MLIPERSAPQTHRHTDTQTHTHQLIVHTKEGESGEEKKEKEKLKAKKRGKEEGMREDDWMMRKQERERAVSGVGGLTQGQEETRDQG